MKLSIRGVFPWVFLVGVLLLGPQVWAMKGRTISIGDAPSMKEGSPDLVLVEVGDFQCHVCGRGIRDLMQPVYEKFVRTGKVELVFLNMPLPMHPYAFKAAEAAACAGDQNMFWEMHHQLFANQQSLAPDRLPGYAEEVGLDVAAFQKCLDGGRHAGEIRSDMRVAQRLGITGTPAYVLGRRIPGGDKLQVLEIVRGLGPYEDLEKKIDELLAAK